MSLTDIWFGSQMQETKKTAFDYATKLFLPALAIIGSIIVRTPGATWGLIGLAVFSICVGSYSSIRSTAEGGLSRAKDERVARKAFPKFRSYVSRFGQFINPGTSDTLHYVAHGELCQGHGALIPKLGLPDMALWTGHLRFLSERVNSERGNLREFQLAMDEFHALVGTYNNQCFGAVFGRLPEDLRASMSPQTKASLNLIHMRFEHFLSDYENFANDVCAPRPALNALPRIFAHYKPLA